MAKKTSVAAIIDEVASQWATQPVEPTPRERYLAAAREWHDADAALSALGKSADSEAVSAASLRLKKAESVRMLMERFADQVSDEDVAAITGTGVHGRTYAVPPKPNVAELLRAAMQEPKEK